MNELFGLLKEKDITMAQNPVSVDKLGQIIDVVESGLISGQCTVGFLSLVFFSFLPSAHPCCVPSALDTTYCVCL